MDEIGRLLEELAGGRITAAVPLLVLLRARGVMADVEVLRRVVAEARRAPRVIRSSREETLRFLGRRVRDEFWHLMPNRDELLRGAEEWLAGADPEAGDPLGGPV